MGKIKRLFLGLMTTLPLLTIGFVDYSVYVSVGENYGRGFTIGPWFITIDKGGDSVWGWWPWTPKNGEYMTSFTFEWSSREGFKDLAYKSTAAE